MGPQLALCSLQGSGAAEGKHRWDFLTRICRICASCTENHRSRMMKQDQCKRNLNRFRQYFRSAVLISPAARMQTRLFKCNPRDFPRASLAKFLDWLWVFVCGQKRTGKRSVSLSCECQMVPIAPPAGQEGLWPPGSSARSCSLLRHVRTYYTAEGSICSGRHLPECTPTPQGTTPVPLS